MRMCGKGWAPACSVSERGRVVRKVALIVVSLLVLALSSQAGAVPKPLPHGTHLSVKQKVAYFERSIHKDKTAIAWALKHRHLAGVNKTLRWYRKALIRHKKLYVRYKAKLIAASWPPHHALWLCIHRYEGAWDDPNSGNNGHYGGLQMTPGWLGYFSGTANNYSQFQQEWFAERGYRDSGYSRGWLAGQWGQTIGPCWQHA